MKRPMIWVGAAVLLAVGGWVALGRAQGGTGLRAVEAAVGARFPSVRQASADEVMRLNRPLLIDVRQPAEFAVSHLPGAVRLDPDRPDFSQLTGVDPARPVVVYCSVGYRSSAMAVRLDSLGFHRVMNLRGGIFRWVEQARPLVDSLGRPVAVVHPYDATWGRLIAPRFRAK